MPRGSGAILNIAEDFKKDRTILFFSKKNNMTVRKNFYDRDVCLELIFSRHSTR
jgi:hypothetical protein